jgi:hypothetical protein
MADFKAETSIDTYNLDKEWIRQADLYDKYGQLANKAYNSFTTLKNELKVVRGNLEMRIRQGFVDIGCKITENAISSYIDIQDDIIKLEQEIARAKYEYEVYNTATFAMEHKKRSLEWLTKLFLGNYFADGQQSDLEEYKKRVLENRS